MDPLNPDSLPACMEENLPWEQEGMELPLCPWWRGMGAWVLWEQGVTQGVLER